MTRIPSVRLVSFRCSSTSIGIRPRAPPTVRSGRCPALRSFTRVLQNTLPFSSGSASTSRGPFQSPARSITVTQAAVQAHAQSCAHHVGSGAAGADTGKPVIRTPRRVATSSDPSPRTIGYRSIQPSPQAAEHENEPPAPPSPIAHRHASIGTGPTRASHCNPANEAGPARSSPPTPIPLLAHRHPHVATAQSLGPPPRLHHDQQPPREPDVEPDHPNATCGGRVVRLGCPPRPAAKPQ